MLSQAHTARPILVFSLLVLTAASALAGTTADYFTVAPAVAAPGQFVQFSWSVSGANGLVVTPSLLSEDEIALPSRAQNETQVAPALSTTYQAVAVGSR